MFVVVLCLVAFGARASAQAAVLRRPALHWVREDDSLHCVDPRTLAERVEELVGPVLVRASEAEHSIEAQVRRVKQGALRVEVRVLDAWGAKLGERSFEHAAGGCAELTPAIAFVIAMTIDPDVAAHGLPPALVALLGGEEPAEEKLMREVEIEPAPPPAPEPEPALPVVRPRPQLVDSESPPPPELPPTSHQLAALVRGGWHEGARGTLGLELRYLQRAAYSWLLAGGYVRFGQQLGSFALPSERSLSITTFDVGVQACGAQRSTARVRITGCLGVEATLAFGRGEGFAPNDVQLRTTGAGVAQLTARVRIVEPFGVMLSINGRAALDRRAFWYEDLDDQRVVVFRTPIFSGGLAVGPSWEF